MRVGAIDLGSNTIKLTIADLAGGTPHVLADRADITRLGEGLDQNGALLSAAMDRTYERLKAYVALCRSFDVEAIRCVATAGMRGAGNGEAFLDRVKLGLGVELVIIDGLREAELAFRAPSRLHGPGPILVVDVGGRSTELVFGRGNDIEASVSLEFGGVRLTERFLTHDPPKAEELLACRAFLDAEYRRAAPPAPGATIVGVCGTVMALYGRSIGEPDMGAVVARGEGAWLTTEAVGAQLASLAGVPAEERLYGSVIPRGRHDVIVAGALVTLSALEHYGASRMRVSDRGVRHGLLLELAEALG